MHIMNTKCGTYFLADTLINRKPTTETLIDIAKLSYDSVRFLPKILLSLWYPIRTSGRIIKEVP